MPDSLFPQYFENLLNEKEKSAIQFLRQEEPVVGNPPYWVGFSGGKDSVVLKDLVLRAKVRHEFHYSVTTIDPPELIRFIRDCHPDIMWDKPRRPFMIAMSERGLPMRPYHRWCCQEYKESGPASTSKCRLVVLGIRRAESSNRKVRKAKEQCFRVKSKIMINPILEWLDEDIWNYIKKHKIPYCNLYDQGFARLGCVGCPFASQKNRDREFEKWPKYRKLYKIYINKLWKKNKHKPWAKAFDTGDELAEAWITKINPFPPKVLTELFDQYGDCRNQKDNGI
ncbi:MAG: phosphoadenosine phosphosulfate reductase family protein [Methylococcaceae bacterium]